MVDRRVCSSPQVVSATENQKSAICGLVLKHMPDSGAFRRVGFSHYLDENIFEDVEPGVV